MKKYIIVCISMLLLVSCTAKKKAVDKKNTSIQIEQIEKEKLDRIEIIKKELKNLNGKIVVSDYTMPVTIEFKDEKIIFENAKEINFDISHKAEDTVKNESSNKETESGTKIDDSEKKFNKTVFRPDVVIFIFAILCCFAYLYFSPKKKIL